MLNNKLKYQKPLFLILGFIIISINTFIFFDL